MPKFRVTERQVTITTWIIDATDEEEALLIQGEGRTDAEGIDDDETSLDAELATDVMQKDFATPLAALSADDLVYHIEQDEAFWEDFTAAKHYESIAYSIYDHALIEFLASKYWNSLNKPMWAAAVALAEVNLEAIRKIANNG